MVWESELNYHTILRDLEHSYIGQVDLCMNLALDQLLKRKLNLLDRIRRH